MTISILLDLNGPVMLKEPRVRVRIRATTGILRLSERWTFNITLAFADGREASRNFIWHNAIGGDLLNWLNAEMPYRDLTGEEAALFSVILAACPPYSTFGSVTGGPTFLVFYCSLARVPTRSDSAARARRYLLDQFSPDTTIKGVMEKLGMEPALSWDEISFTLENAPETQAPNRTLGLG